MKINLLYYLKRTPRERRYIFIKSKIEKYSMYDSSSLELLADIIKKANKIANEN